jgi:hypothetical protein
MTRRVVGIERAMPNYDRSWFQRLDFIDGGKPGEQPLVVRLDEVGMSVVVDGITCDDQDDRRHVEQVV